MASGLNRWRNVSYSYRVRAVDVDGNMGPYSAVVNVLKPGPQILGALFLDGDHLRLDGSGDANTAYLVQASTNLVQWDDLGPTTPGGEGAFVYVDGTTSGFTQRFYRVT